MRLLLVISLLFSYGCNADNYIDIFRCTLDNSNEVMLSIDNDKAILKVGDNKSILKKEDILYNQNHRYQSEYVTLKIGDEYILFKNYDKEFSDDVEYGLIDKNNKTINCSVLEKESFKMIPQFFQCDKTDALGCK